MYIVRGNLLLEVSGNVQTRTYIFQVETVRFHISQTRSVPVQWTLWPERSVPERSQTQLVSPLGGYILLAKGVQGPSSVMVVGESTNVLDVALTILSYGGIVSTLKL